MKLQECCYEVRQDDDKPGAWPSRQCRRARISRGGSSCQSKGMEGSLVVRVSLIAPSFCVKITSGGSRLGTGIQCNWWCAAVQLERSEQSLSHAGERGPQRGEGVLGPRSAAGCVRESRVRSEAFGESADGRRQLCGHASRGSGGRAG